MENITVTLDDQDMELCGFFENEIATSQAHIAAMQKAKSAALMASIRRAGKPIGNYSQEGRTLIYHPAEVKE